MYSLQLCKQFQIQTQIYVKLQINKSMPTVWEKGVVNIQRRDPFLLRRIPLPRFIPPV
jgi:hypothetical protein